MRGLARFQISHAWPQKDWSHTDIMSKQAYSLHGHDIRIDFILAAFHSTSGCPYPVFMLSERFKRSCRTSEESWETLGSEVTQAHGACLRKERVDFIAVRANKIKYQLKKLRKDKGKFSALLQLAPFARGNRNSLDSPESFFQVRFTNPKFPCFFHKCSVSLSLRVYPTPWLLLHPTTWQRYVALLMPWTAASWRMRSGSRLKVAKQPNWWHGTGMSLSRSDWGLRFQMKSGAGLFCPWNRSPSGHWLGLRESLVTQSKGLDWAGRPPKSNWLSRLWIGFPWNTVMEWNPPALLFMCILCSGTPNEDTLYGSSAAERQSGNTKLSMHVLLQCWRTRALR